MVDASSSAKSTADDMMRPVCFKDILQCSCSVASIADRRHAGHIAVALAVPLLVVRSDCLKIWAHEANPRITTEPKTAAT